MNKQQIKEILNEKGIDFKEKNGQIIIEAEKKFEGYIIGYTSTIRYHIPLDTKDWPFEYKIGLLKYICDAIDYDFKWILSDILKGFDLNCELYREIARIVPDEFIKSIFE